MLNLLKNLKILRQEKDMNQTQLADEIGVSRSAIAMYESGKREPDNETLIKLAKYFNTSVDYLLGNSDVKEKTPSEEGVNFDNFTYALFDETKDLTDADKEMLLNMAKMLKERKDKEK